MLPCPATVHGAAVHAGTWRPPPAPNQPKIALDFIWLLFLINILNDEFDQHLRTPF